MGAWEIYQIQSIEMVSSNSFWVTEGTELEEERERKGWDQVSTSRGRSETGSHSQLTLTFEKLSLLSIYYFSLSEKDLLHSP